jgi:hypothetical protein
MYYILICIRSCWTFNSKKGVTVSMRPLDFIVTYIFIYAFFVLTHLKRA